MTQVWLGCDHPALRDEPVEEDAVTWGELVETACSASPATAVSLSRGPGQPSSNCERRSGGTRSTSESRSWTPTAR